MSLNYYPTRNKIPSIDERVRRLETFPSAVLVTKPTIEGNLSLPIGGESTFTVSASSLLPDAYITKFEYWLGYGEVQTVSATLNSATITVQTPDGAEVGDLLELYVRVYDNNGSSNINSVTLTVIGVGVATPTISGKTTNVVKGEATFTGSAFTVIGGEGTHDQSDWILYKQSEPDVEVWSSKRDPVYLTTVPEELNDYLESGETYILKLRYHDSNMDLWSDYGSITFTMATIAVRTPTISGKTTDVLKWFATFTGSPFEIAGTSEGTHDKSDWVLVKANAPSSEIWSSKNDSVNKTTSPSTINDVLEVSTNYIVKLRYHDAITGLWSDWGQLGFTTAAEFRKPWEVNVETQGVHFIAATDGTNIDMFGTSLGPDNKFEVWINGEKTNQRYDRISFSEGDDVLIKNVEGGRFPRVIFSSNLYSKGYVREIVEPFPKFSTFPYTFEVTDISQMFAGCENLVSISPKLFWNNPQITNFQSAFSTCSSLTEIPADIFKYNTEATNFMGAFYGCSSLTSIPEDLFRYNTKVNYISNIFTSCTSLSSIPADLFRYNTKVMNMSKVFYGCSSLTSIPADLFKYNTEISNMSETFRGCAGVSSVSIDLFKYNTKLTNLYRTFYNCTALTVVLRIPATEITECEAFADGSKATGTVYVPSGSTTASNFKSARDTNVNVIEE